MAVTQDQITLIHEALTALDITPGDADALGRDVNAGLQALVKLVNADADPSQRIAYDPAVGYTPELGQKLLVQIEHLKTSALYKSVEKAYNTPLVGKELAQGALSMASNVPRAIQNDPEKLFKLLNSASQTVAALDVAYTAGQLSVKAETPAPGVVPAGGPQPGAKLDPFGRPIVAPDASGTDSAKDSTTEETKPAEPPLPPLSVASATMAVEITLQQLIPQLNKKLEDADKKAQGQINDLPDFLRDLAGMFKNAAGGQFLELRIPEISDPDGVFDWKSQAALQGLLTVLGHPMALNFRQDPTLAQVPDWYYTKAKGQFILSHLDELKEKLSKMMSEEELKKIEPMLSQENVGKLVRALDYLQEHGLITDLYLFENNFQPPLYTQDLFQDLVTQYQAVADDGEPKNLDMIRLMDALTRQYAGPEKTLEFLMPELSVQNLGVEPSSDPAVQKQQLAQFYKAARERHQGTPQQFSDELYIMLNTVITLPFGEGDYRRGFNRVVEDAIRAAGAEDDPEKAAEIFAKTVSEGTAGLVHDHGAPQYVRYNERDVPVWKPGLANMPAIVSGGQSFTAQDIAKAYDNFQAYKAPMVLGEGATSLPIDYHASVVFRDDAGDVWVAAVNRNSMVFSIEKIDVQAVHDIYMREDIPYDERRQMMRDASAGWALIDQKDGPFLGSSVPNMIDFVSSDRVPQISDFSKEYSGWGDALKAQAAAKAANEAAKPIPFISKSFAGAHDAPEMTRAESLAHPQPVEKASAHEIARIHELRKFTAESLQAVPLVITPGQSGRLNLLREFAGQDLHIGTTLGDPMPIHGVDMMVSDSYTGPVMAWYDAGNGRVEVVEMPEDLMTRGGRAALRALAERSYGDPAGFLKEMMARPILHDMVRDQELKLFRGNTRERLNGEPINANDLRQMQTALMTILNRVDQVLPARPGGGARAPGDAFKASDAVGNPSVSRASELGENAADVTGVPARAPIVVVSPLPDPAPDSAG